MSNDWLNIRFGCWHIHAKKWFLKWHIGYNDFHENNPKRFEVYTIFPFF